MNKLLCLSIALLLVFTHLACASTESPSPTHTLKETTSKTVTPPKAEQWEREWENTLAEAKKEGVVSIYALWAPAIRIALTQAFKAKYGINLEFTTFSRGEDLAAKAQQEKTASLYSYDVFGAGAPSLVTTLKPIGLLGPMNPLLVLPEVNDPTKWSGGKFPFVDNEKLAVGMLAGPQRFIMYNTDLLKKGELTTYKDVLKPQYKGKIILNDPSVTGAGNAFMTHLILHIWNLEEAKEFLRQLIKQQEVVIQRDNRILVESVARGKFAIGLAPLAEALVEFLNAKAPVDVVIVKEGLYVTPGPGAVAVPAKFAHPNAAKVFVNWLLTKEGQTVFSQSAGNPSLRADVSTEGINPVYLPQPGEKLFLQDEEDLLFRSKTREICKEIIQASIK